MVGVIGRRSSARNKLIVRSLAVGGAIFAAFRCCLLFIESNSLVNLQVQDPTSLNINADHGKQPLHVSFDDSQARTDLKKLPARISKHGVDGNEHLSKKEKRNERVVNKGITKMDRYDTARKVMDKAVQHDDERKQIQDSDENKDADSNDADVSETNKKKKSSRKRHFHVVDTKDRPVQTPKKTERRIAKKKKRLPFYLHGKYDFLKGPHDPRKKLINNLRAEKYKSIGSNVHTWVLPTILAYPTRNHDSVILERGKHATRPIMVTLLGRFNRYIQSMDLLTGKQWVQRTKGKDPSGNALDDLNHVTAVLVDKLDPNTGQEIWLPCGFHNDRVNHEESTDYVRIVDTDTMKVRVGPKLPVAGGACISKALTIIPNEPPMICSFAGTQGNHDKGTFLPFTQCYDRIREKWWTPFGKLPYGLDHGNLAVIPAGTCHSKDPARILIFNFRTRPYGTPHSEFLAFDIPSNGWTVDMLKKNEIKPPNNWYIYHNVTDTSLLLKNVGRDASGVVTANNGRYILNFGGTYRTKKHTRGNNKVTKKGRTSMIRSFDVCRKEWNVVGDLGLQTFALQTAASDSLGVAVTCGGEAPLAFSNSPYCFVSRWTNMTVSNPQTPIVLAGSTGKRASAAIK